MSKARIAIALVVTLAFLTGAAGITTAVVADAATTLYATTADVNVRSGPSTSTKVVTTLKPGVIVAAAGNKAGDWQPISFNGTTAYLFARYVTLTKSTTTPTTYGSPGKQATTANVNLRSAASLSSTVLRVLKQGTSVDGTGRRFGDFTEVKVDGSLRWLYTRYLGAANTTAPTPVTVAKVITAATLTLRQDASATSASLGNLKPSTEVGLTGKHSGSYTQVVAAGKTGWVLTGYLKPAPSGPTVTLPVSIGQRYLNAAGVNVRAAADAESEKLATLPRGTLLLATGPTKNKYTQVIFNGRLAWVASEYLSGILPSADSLGSSSLDKLLPNGKAGVLAVRDKFPEIKTIFGWRSSSAYSADHPSGRAIDIMIPSYKSNKALGDRIAKYFIDNHKSLHVKYLIWRQRNYTITRGAWVHMADRGGDTENHYDHVHVSFLP